MGDPNNQDFWVISKMITLNELDKEATTKLFRDASQAVQPPCRYILYLFRAHKFAMNPLKPALTQGNLQLAESLLKKGARLDG